MNIKEQVKKRMAEYSEGFNYLRDNGSSEIKISEIKNKLESLYTKFFENDFDFYQGGENDFLNYRCVRAECFANGLDFAFDDGFSDVEWNFKELITWFEREIEAAIKNK